MRLPHRLQGQKSRSRGAGAYCGGHLAAQLVRDKDDVSHIISRRPGLAHSDHAQQTHQYSNNWHTAGTKERAVPICVNTV